MDTEENIHILTHPCWWCEESSGSIDPEGNSGILLCRYCGAIMLTPRASAEALKGKLEEKVRMAEKAQKDWRMEYL